MTSAAAAARQGITYHARQCVDALRLADYAAQEGLLAIECCLRKLASIHAKDAWRWVTRLDKPRADA